VSVAGEVIVGDVDIAGGNPLAATRRGVAMVPEREKIFPSLTVAEHFRLIEPSSTAGSAGSKFEALARLWGSRAGLLSGGERQMLAIAMALLHRPKLLLIDEMSLGLAPVIVKSLMKHLDEMTTSSGVATVMVEQDATAALRVAERVYLLERGRIVWKGRSEETTSAELGHNYLGTKL
jgi:ABC-type branched-subunit amino acid transport system ATPase component